MSSTAAHQADPAEQTPDDSDSLEPDSAILDYSAIRSGLHVMTGLLLAVAIGSSLRLEFNDAAFNLLLCTVFAVFYYVGFEQVRFWGELRRQAWMAAVVGIWILVMLLVPVGIYLIFPVYFVVLRAMPDIRGVVSVLFATALAILMQIPNGITLGGVMGPAVSAAVTLAMFYAVRTLIRLNRQREEAVQELMATRDQLAESQRAEGVAAERQRLAHEIHDTVAQGLSSIQMLLHVAEADLESGDEGKAVERMELARTTASENLAEARAMIAALQPVSLGETNLEGAMQRMVASFAGAANVAIEVDVVGEEQQLPMKTEATLLRIAQGAVGNVAKHSAATRCRVTVTYQPDEVRLDVVDNGRGFDPEEVEAQPAGLGHVGLAAMRQRAAEMGGELFIESQVGGPTAVTVALPLGRDEPAERSTG